ncbi:MAG: tRNA dihydrouridine synthase DusB [candidate division Zixibacteria bacterium]|nr:tRNA dihydrouridine synthase DusB [candidate division Zixibacteria bacterium]
MQIGNLNISGRLLLAPLAGISKRPFRLIARRFGASVCYTEMISTDGMVYEQGKTIAMLDHTPDEHPIGIQLFGSKPENMAKAVVQIQHHRPDLIDLNFGCPVKKVIKKNGGAAILKDISLAGELMAAAVENTAVPVTIKIRSGWSNDSEVYLELGKMAERIGIAAVTLHPRFRTDGFSGHSDWNKITLLKREVSIPVIGNGDIVTPNDARDMLEQTGCDGIMIGRAAMRNPYIFRRIERFLEDGTEIPDLGPREKIDLALEHSRGMIAQYGERSGSFMIRKHLAWYTKGFTGGAELRRRLMTVESYDDIVMSLNEYLQQNRIDING